MNYKNDYVGHFLNESQLTLPQIRSGITRHAKSQRKTSSRFYIDYIIIIIELIFMQRYF